MFFFLGQFFYCPNIKRSRIYNVPTNKLTFHNMFISIILWQCDLFRYWVVSNCLNVILLYSMP